jgi:DNA-binding CsgD family transcriptional regulator
MVSCRAGSGPCGGNAHWVLSAGRRNIRDHHASCDHGGGDGQTAEVGGGTGSVLECTSVGATLREAASAAGVSRTTGHYWLRDSGGRRPRARRPRPALRLSLAEREEISRGMATRLTLTAIAHSLGRSVSTVSREVARNRGPGGYRAVAADPRPRPTPGAPSPQARGGRPAAGPCRTAAGPTLVAAADLGPAGLRRPPRPADAGLPRDDLHLAVRPGPRRVARAPDSMPAH